MTNSCYHCGAHIPKHVHIQMDILGQSRDLCCVGCQTVATAILANGGENFYQFRTDNSQTPDFTLDTLPTTISQELQLFDNDDVLDEISEPLDLNQQRSITLMVEGITCAACSWLIEKQLNQFEGVISANLNLSQHRLTVVWSQELTPLSALISRIYALGFKAQPYRADQAQQQLQQEQKLAARRLVLAAFGTMQAMMFAVPLYVGDWAGMFVKFETYFRFAGLAIATPVVLYSARPFFQAFIRDIKSRHLTMDVPVSIAIGGAYLASVWSTFTHGQEVYFDSVCMFTFFLLLGRFLEARARLRNGDAGNHLHNLMPRSVIRLHPTDASEVLIPVTQLSVGDTIRVLPGSIVCADGQIIKGQSSIDESIITGEFVPVKKHIHDSVIAGSLNVDSPIDVKVSALGKDMKISTIMSLLDRADQQKPKIALLADQIAQYFVACVLVLSVAVFTVWYFISPEDAFWITLSVLVATCPCALSLATPTALTSASTALRRFGILITKSHVLESLPNSKTIIFDKTGTLTLGQLSISETRILRPSDLDPLQIAASLEHFSPHPIAHAFEHPDMLAIEGIQVITGQGVKGFIDAMEYRIGLASFACPDAPDAPDRGHWILLSANQQPLAWFLLQDQLRPDAKQCIDQLQQQGLSCELLSGDQSDQVEYVANRLNMDKAQGSVSPEGKLNYVKQIPIQQHAIMVGDGINDVPVLAQAPISVAVGSASDLAKTHADIILINNQVSNIAVLIAHAKKTRRIIKQNLAWSLLYNASVLPLAALGFLPPYLAAIGMSASSLVVVFNALRLNKLVTLK